MFSLELKEIYFRKKNFFSDFLSMCAMLHQMKLIHKVYFNENPFQKPATTNRVSRFRSLQFHMRRE